MNYEMCIANLVYTMEQAIKSGDWKVDGACDPSLDIERAKHILRNSGWYINPICVSLNQGDYNE